MNDPDDNELEEGAESSISHKPVMPGKVSVYDRPEPRRLSPVLLVALVILALLISYLLWQFVF